MYVAHSYYSAAKNIESESLNCIFQMYGHDAEKPRPSLLYKVLPYFVIH